MSSQSFFGLPIIKYASLGFAALLALAALAWAEGHDDCAQTNDRTLRIDACTKIINSEEFSDGERAVAHFNRGSAQEFLGEISNAIEDYTSALRLNPEMAAAHYNRANAYFALEDYVRAIDDYDQAVRLDPTAANALNNRGEVYSRLGDNKRAVADFSQALEVDPDYIDAYRNRGVVYEYLGEYGRAVRDWDREIELGGAERARWWQEYLTGKGHYSGEIDGKNSPAIWAALTACAADPDC